MLLNSRGSACSAMGHSASRKLTGSPFIGDLKGPSCNIVSLIGGPGYSELLLDSGKHKGSPSMPVDVPLLTKTVELERSLNQHRSIGVMGFSFSRDTCS